MTDNTYTWDAVPADLYGTDVTLESVQPKVVEAIQQVISSENYCGISAVATRVFDRKGRRRSDVLYAMIRDGSLYQVPSERADIEEQIAQLRARQAQL